MYTVIDTAVCTLDGPSEQFDVAPDGALLTQVLPALLERVVIVDLPVDDHDAVHERWEDLSEWRTVRRDIKLLRQAVERAHGPVDDGVHA